MFNYCL